MLENEDAITPLLAAAVRSGLAPGFVALWGGPDTHQGAAWGWRGLGAGEVTSRVWYDLASLTKPLVTSTLVLLARRHGMGLHDPLGRFLPELAGSVWASVTVFQCLTHTAGFPAWAPLYAYGEPSPGSYLRALVGIAPVHAAGTAVVYSCLGFVALGLAVERVGNAPLQKLFQREVLLPLGLTEELDFCPPISRPVALGEKRFFVEERLCREHGVSARPPRRLAGAWSCDDGNARGLGGVAGNAGLFGTALGVLQLAQEYLPGFGRLLKAEEVALATSNHTPNMAQARGLGWQLAATPGCSAGPALSPASFGHTGFTGPSVWVDPEPQAVFVLLGNRLHPGGRTPDLHPLRRRFHILAARGLRRNPSRPSILLL